MNFWLNFWLISNDIQNKLAVPKLLVISCRTCWATIVQIVFFLNKNENPLVVNRIIFYALIILLNHYLSLWLKMSQIMTDGHKLSQTDGKSDWMGFQSCYSQIKISFLKLYIWQSKLCLHDVTVVSPDCVWCCVERGRWDQPVAGAAEVIHFITASSASSTLLLPVTQQHKTNLEVNINFLF